MREPTQLLSGEGRRRWSRNERIRSIGPAGVVATACRQSGPGATREAPAVIASWDQPATRESQAGPCGVAERSVLPKRPGNSGGGKGPQLKTDARSNEGHGELTMSLATPGCVQKLQTASHVTSCVFSQSRMRESCLSGSMSGLCQEDE